MPSYSSPSLSHLSIDKLHEKRAFHLEVIRLARIDLRNLREGTETISGGSFKIMRRILH
jgi:hypothetical protein